MATRHPDMPLTASPSATSSGSSRGHAKAGQHRARLATARKAAGLTQEDLAAALHVERSTVVRWEAGRHAPQSHLWPKLATVLDLTRADLGVLLAHADTTEMPRTVAALSPDASHEQPLVAGNLHEVEYLRQSLHDVLAGGAVSEASLADWELTLARYGAASRDQPAAVLLADLHADCTELTRTLAQCRSVSTLRALTRVTANMSGLMCLTLIKLGERGAFRRWARTARTAASEAGDPATYSWVRAQEAYGHFYGDDLPAAVSVARHAQAVVKAPCVGAVLAAALEARALAALGRTDETYAALRQAETLLAALDAGEVVASAFGYNEAQLRFHESNALTHLGDTTAAWTAQDRALDLVPAADFMDRAFTQLDRAMCLAHDGDATGATTHARDTLLGLSEQQRQGIVSSRAHQLLNALPPHRQTVPPARELRDLLMLPANTEG